MDQGPRYPGSLVAYALKEQYIEWKAILRERWNELTWKYTKKGKGKGRTVWKARMQQAGSFVILWEGALVAGFFLASIGNLGLHIYIDERFAEFSRKRDLMMYFKERADISKAKLHQIKESHTYWAEAHRHSQQRMQQRALQAQITQLFTQLQHERAHQWLSCLPAGHPLLSTPVPAVPDVPSTAATAASLLPKHQPEQEGEHGLVSSGDAGLHASSWAQQGLEQQQGQQGHIQPASGPSVCSGGSSSSHDARSDVSRMLASLHAAFSSVLGRLPAGFSLPMMAVQTAAARPVAAAAGESTQGMAAGTCSLQSSSQPSPDPAGHDGPGHPLQRASYHGQSEVQQPRHGPSEPSVPSSVRRTIAATQHTLSSTSQISPSGCSSSSSCAGAARPYASDQQLQLDHDQAGTPQQCTTPTCRSGANTSSSSIGPAGQADFRGHNALAAAELDADHGHAAAMNQHKPHQWTSSVTAWVAFPVQRAWVWYAARQARHHLQELFTLHRQLQTQLESLNHWTSVHASCLERAKRLEVACQAEVEALWEITQQLEQWQAYKPRENVFDISWSSWRGSSTWSTAVWIPQWLADADDD